MGDDGRAVKTLYTCIICGRSFSSRKALFGHMRVHRDVKWKRLTVRLPAELVDRFYKVVRDHKTTTCAVVHSLVQAVVKGEELGVFKLSSSNPSYVVIQEFFNARPRGHGKYDLSGLEPVVAEAATPKCVVCGAPAVGEAVQYNGHRVPFCFKHRWLKNYAPIYRLFKR